MTLKAMKRINNMKILGLLFVLFTWQIGHSQTEWTLKQCLDYALKNNNSIKMSELSLQSSQINYQQSKEALFPSLSGFGGYNFNFGRNINPVNNTYVQTNVQSSQFGISSQLILFNGLQNTNTIKLNQLNTEASKKDLEVMSNSISLQVVTQFLQILFAKETIKTQEVTILSTQKQLETAKVLFEAGNTNKSAVYELEAKLSSDKLNLVTAQNNHRLARVALANLLQIPFEEGFDIVSPQVAVPEETILEGSDKIFDSAINTMPEIELARLRYKASAMQKTISRGSYYPTLSLSANVSSLFSNNFKDPVNPHTIYVPIGFVQATNQDVYTQTTGYDGLKTRAFGKQVNDNLGKSVGFNLSIPIYSNARIRTAVKQADIASEQQKINMLNTQNQLFTSIATAVANYTGARSKYAALLGALNAQKNNLEFNTIRFESGALSSLDLVISKTNFETAEANLLQGKYDLIFRKVLLDFYRGKPLVLN
jgi:outer membrane protein